MIDIEKRRKWNYNETSAQRYEKYVSKMNMVHSTPTEMYPGQFQMPVVHAPRTPQEARQLIQMQMEMEAQMNRVNPYTGRPVGVPGYIAPFIPPTPAGFIGAPMYSPYGRRY